MGEHVSPVPYTPYQPNGQLKPKNDQSTFESRMAMNAIMNNPDFAGFAMEGGGGFPGMPGSPVDPAQPPAQAPSGGPAAPPGFDPAHPYGSEYVEPTASTKDPNQAKAKSPLASSLLTGDIGGGSSSGGGVGGAAMAGLSGYGGGDGSDSSGDMMMAPNGLRQGLGSRSFANQGAPLAGLMRAY